MAETFRSSLEQIQSLLTPQDLLEQEYLSKPDKIDPANFPDFPSLLAERKRIRMLQLLPVRTEEERARYQSQPQEQMRDEIENYLKEVNFALRRNPYPYDLSSDVGQHIVWLKDKDAPPEAISAFIANSLGIMNRKSEIRKFLS